MIGLYFLVLLGVALWVILQKQKDTADYFLAGRNMGWFVVGASIFASNIGSEHVVGLGRYWCFRQDATADLRTSRLGSVNVGMGVSALLRPGGGVYHARVSGKTLQPPGSLVFSRCSLYWPTF